MSTYVKKYLLKSEFCEKYKINQKFFTDKLVKIGFLQYHCISVGYNHGPQTKMAYGVTDKGKGSETFSPILKHSGTWQQGTFKYHENYFKKVFDIE